MADKESESQSDKNDPEILFVAVEQNGNGFPIIADTQRECAKNATIEYDLPWSYQYEKNWDHRHSGFQESNRFLDDELSWVPQDNPTGVVMYRVVEDE